MTSYVNTKGEVVVTEPKEEKKPEEKVEEKPLLEPRFKNNKKLWNEAMWIADMHTFRRPHQSKSEMAFIRKFIVPVGVTFDKKGNAHKIIGDAPVLWSCHTDTVHTKGGSQKIEYWVDKNTEDTFIGVARAEVSNCLGADDTAGVWIMLEMIKAKVPGHYIFHRGEECGGLGSRWLADKEKELIKTLKFAIAFDRRDTESIITFQRGERCCSDEFANSLSEQIGMKHKPDQGGMWTDTAAYTDLIGECTNVSVGYYDAHSGTEKLNIDYMLKLRDAMCKIDVTKLVDKRKPGELERKTYNYQYHNHDYNYGSDGFFGGNGWGRHRGHQRTIEHLGFTYKELEAMYDHGDWHPYYEWDKDLGYWFRKKGTTLPKVLLEKLTVPKKKDLGVTKGWKRDDDFRPAPTGLQAKWLVQDNPEIILDLLESLGYDAIAIRTYVEATGGGFKHLKW